MWHSMILKVEALLILKGEALSTTQTKSCSSRPLSTKWSSSCRGWIRRRRKSPKTIQPCSSSKRQLRKLLSRIYPSSLIPAQSLRLVESIEGGNNFWTIFLRTRQMSAITNLCLMTRLSFRSWTPLIIRMRYKSSWGTLISSISKLMLECRAEITRATGSLRKLLKKNSQPPIKERK